MFKTQKLRNEGQLVYESVSFVIVSSAHQWYSSTTASSEEAAGLQAGHLQCIVSELAC